MTAEQIKRALDSCGYQIVEEEELGDGNGLQFRLRSGQVVNLYHTGKFVVQGKNPEPVKACLENFQEGHSDLGGRIWSRKVFVVYGHDEVSKARLEAMLRRWNLEPLFLDQLPSEGQTLIEKLEKYRHEVAYAVVLATPDDEGHRADRPDEKAYRARQNVVLELGMMLAILGRSRVAILLKDPERMERPSDIQGLIYISFKDDVEEAKLSLAKEMNAQGLRIDLSRL